MILDAAEERLVVISDLHIGSPANRSVHLLASFIDHVRDAGWPLCINGDAIDLLQYSLPQLLADAATALEPLRRFVAGGGRLYYVLGNHDLVLEHLLFALPIRTAPVLNLMSGSKRIRIEHGHVHEPVFARAPGLYEFGGRLGRIFLLTTRDSYRLYSAAQRWVHDHRRSKSTEDYASYRAADELFERGFDAVVMGHTHLPEVVERPMGTFVNGGDWVESHTYVTIERGDVALRRWPADRLDVP